MSRRGFTTAAVASVVTALLAACGAEPDRPRAGVTAPASSTTALTVDAVAGGAAAQTGERGTNGAASTPSPGTAGSGTAPRPVVSGSAGTPPTSAATAAPSPAEALAPTPGRYVYATTGYSQSGSGPTARRSDLPPTTTDEVHTSTSATGASVVTITTDYGDGSRSTLELEVAGTNARLTRLSFASTNNGVTSEQAVTPSPPILLARSPYRDGDSWESAWQDAALGVQGVGTGSVLRHETVDSSRGSSTTAVVHLDHRLRGTITGRLEFTIWIDPHDAVRLRDELIVDFQMAGNPQHLESRRTLAG